MVDGPGFTEESVLAFVMDLHAANPAQQRFSVIDIAREMAPAEMEESETGENTTNTWLESLNNILKKLGQEGRITVSLEHVERGVEYAVVLFPVRMT